MTTKIIQADGIIVHCEHTKIIPVAELKPYPKNNKIHPPDQITLLSKAIKAQGWRAPITVSNQSGYIVRGHARLEAAKKLGVKSVPVDYQDYASEQAERADRIADNKIADLGEWHLPNLKDELLSLDSGELDLDITGFDEKAIELLMTQFHVPDENKPIDESSMADTKNECPKCGFKW